MAERGERDKGKGGDRKSQSQAATVKLESLGLDKHESSRFQQIAAVPQKQFDAHLAEAKRMQQPVTSASVRALTRQAVFSQRAAR
jgi:hypothetical protein